VYPDPAAGAHRGTNACIDSLRTDADADNRQEGRNSGWSWKRMGTRDVDRMRVPGRSRANERRVQRRRSPDDGESKTPYLRVNPPTWSVSNMRNSSAGLVPGLERSNSLIRGKPFNRMRLRVHRRTPQPNTAPEMLTLTIPDEIGWWLFRG